MSNEVRVAFIGAGTVAEMHGRGISALPNVRLAGAFDVDPAKATHITSRFGGRVYETLEQLLSDPGVKAVHVLTPVQHHINHAVTALRAGKHVLLEKPVAKTHEEIALLKAEAAQAGRICMPAHNYIYAPSVRRAKRLIDSGKLGSIASLWIVYNIFHSEQVAATYGGVLREVCNHHAYSVLYLLGRPRRVIASASRIRHHYPGAEEQAMIVCEMDNGAVANLWSSFAAGDPTNDPWAVVYKVLGTNGGVSYSWNEAQFDDQGGPAWGMPCYEESFMTEIDYFINRCILSSELPLSTLDDAADALSILTAAERFIARTDAAEIVTYEK
jgi:predicted dehydrogenase